MNTELISFKDLQGWLNLKDKEAVEKWLIANDVPFKPCRKGIVTTATALNRSIIGEKPIGRVVKAKSQ